ncbi:hypothetical protein ATN38_05020 [Rhodococcus sp. FH8]|uniref:RCC1 domain-containing protein n=1 Tax=Rhodococcus sp. FH8 TaxID=1761013 RepID=UPI001C4E4474|nr:cutinase family protein [Rhodococcus sp. FH8]MBW0282600.1 hypothetical protein [Rhodococcus sp. FH8]
MLRRTVFDHRLSRLVAAVIAILVVSGIVMLSGVAAQAGADPVTTTSAESAGATALALGNSHTCALTPSATVKCWGDNQYGQLGDDTPSNRSTPAQVAGVSGATAITAGDSHTCALMPAGTAKCWGGNTNGALGANTEWNFSSTPVQVVGISGATAITAGKYHTCALTAGGTVHCWGDNQYGRLGDGTTENRSTPVQVAGISGATAITAGGRHTCALMSAGTAKCWGNNQYGQVGDGTAIDRWTPINVTDISTATSIYAGFDSTCALVDSGTAKCWGYNGTGQVGDFTTQNRLTPVQVFGIADATAIVVAATHTCALTFAATVKCWGYNDYGQLGDGTYQDSFRPQTVNNIAGATSIATYNRHTCALMAAGAAKCWGYNGTGQVGDGTTTNRPAPVDVVGLTGIIDPGGPQDPEEPTNCKKFHFVGVRGSGEDPQDKSIDDYERASAANSPLPITNPTGTGLGSTIYSTERDVTDQLRKMPYISADPTEASSIAYPAIPVSQYVTNFGNYKRSIVIGANNLRAKLKNIETECPGTEVVIAGYSQGADVINAAMGLEHQANSAGKVMSKVKKIVIFGDPSHLPNRAENIGSGNGSGASIAFGLSVSDAVAYKDSHPGLVTSICTIGDVVCDTSTGNLADALQPVTGLSGNHTLYQYTKMKCPAMGNAWQLATDCAAQTVVSALGYTPIANPFVSDPLLGNFSVNPGSHIVAAIAYVPVTAGTAVVGVGNKIRGWFKSDPMDLGEFELDDQGRGVISFQVPDVPVGQHHLELVASDGSTYVVPITVTDEPVDRPVTVFDIDGHTPDRPAPTNPGGNPDNGGSGSAGSSGSGSLFGS